MNGKRTTIPALVLHLSLLFAGFVWINNAYPEQPSKAYTPPPESLRGATPLDENPTPPRLKDYPKETEKYQPNYVGQPPLIPHAIRGYEVSANYNACMACHSWENARKFKATPIGVSHYRDRNGQMLADVAPERYHCTQCHVAQKDAPALRKNLFEPLKSVTP